MKKLIDIINKFEFVSFDIFDTLIKRNVNEPKDVFKLMQQFCKENDIIISDYFYEERISAERAARKLFGKKEITLTDIYEQMGDKYDEFTIKILVDLEKKIELDVCTVNNDLFTIYEHCIKLGKTVFLISDMYLPEDLVSIILKNCGISKYKNIYISSRSGKTKSSGDLFRYVLKKQNINASQLIHIGDNKKSDYLSARKLGIMAIKIPTHVNHLMYNCENGLAHEDTFEYKTLTAFLNNTIDNTSYFWKMGYETLGPILYGFSRWLYNNLKEKNIKKVYFFSRDGYVIKNAFDKLGYSDIETNYFYASRRALIIPLLWTHPNLEDVLKSMFFPRHITIKNFLRKIGLNSDNYSSLFLENGFTPDYNIDITRLNFDKKFVGFYNSIKQDVISNSKNEYANLIEYIKQSDMNGKIAIVDIGWNGNMQKALNKLIEVEAANIEINGYYIALHPNSQTLKENKLEAQGFLFQPGKNEYMYEIEKSFNSIFETIFLAQHGSVEKYKMQDGEIIPVLYPYEYSKSIGQCNNETFKVQEIQQGAIDFVTRFSESPMKDYIKISPTCCVQNIFNLGNCPSLTDVEIFGDFRFLETGIKYIAKPKSFLFYILHPNKLIQDFNEAPWKIGFMKRLIKIQVSYYAIYKFMRRIYLNKKGEMNFGE